MVGIFAGAETGGEKSGGELSLAWFSYTGGRSGGEERTGTGAAGDARTSVPRFGSIGFHTKIVENSAKSRVKSPAGNPRVGEKTIEILRTVILFKSLFCTILNRCASSDRNEA